MRRLCLLLLGVVACGHKPIVDGWDPEFISYSNPGAAIEWDVTGSPNFYCAHIRGDYPIKYVSEVDYNSLRTVFTHQLVRAYKQDRPASINTGMFGTTITVAYTPSPITTPSEFLWTTEADDPILFVDPAAQNHPETLALLATMDDFERAHCR